MKNPAGIWLVVLAAIALFAPLIANGAPLVASVDGEWRFPAFASYTGPHDLGPDPDSHESWRQWWTELSEDSGDWAVLPPCPWGPLSNGEPERRNEGPSFDHPLGTDSLGRDLLSRMVWGTGTAMRIGLGAVLLALLIGVPMGALAGYVGGVLDHVIMVIVQIFVCFPALFFVLTVGAFVGESSFAVIAVLGLVYWTSIARLVRGEFLSLREREFVLAARGLGVSTASLILRHMLPRVVGPVAVNAAFLFAAAVIVEATLSFLGLGVSGSESWGTILAQSKEPARLGVWHLWLFPVLAVSSTVWCLHSLSDRVRTS